MNFCGMCGKENEAKMLRIPYIAQKGQKLPAATSESIAHGTGQRWDAVHICVGCASKLGEKIKEFVG